MAAPLANKMFLIKYVSKSVILSSQVVFPKTADLRLYCTSINRFSPQSTILSSPLILCQKTYSTASQSTGKQNELDKLYKSMDVEVKGHDPTVLSSYAKFLSMAAQELGVNIVSMVTPKKPIIERWTMLKSVHIYKKHWVQYEARTHKKTIEIKHITGSTADTFLEYVQRNIPEGVAMKVTKHEMRRLPEHIAARPAQSARQAS